MTLSQALIGEAIPPRERGRYQGYLAGIAVSSNSFGPVAGGYLTQAFGWQSIFLINVPLGLLAMAFVFRIPPRQGDRKPHHIRFARPGAVHLLRRPGDPCARTGTAHGPRHAADGAWPPRGWPRLARALDLAGKAHNLTVDSAGAVPGIVDLARRRHGRLPRRGAGLPDHLPADLSACGSRPVAVGDRTDAVAVDGRHRHRLDGHRANGDRTGRTAVFPTYGLLGATAGLLFWPSASRI